MKPMSTVVLDACVAAKTFINESDSPEAVKLISACVKSKIQISAPDIFKYEISQIAVKKDCVLDDILHLFEDAIFKLIDMQDPNRFVWLQAEKICQHGHEKSGFPTMYDSVYHAMAIINDGVFITADKRHYEKAKSFGHIAMLDDWENVLDQL